MDSIEHRIDEWEANALISADEATAIREYEQVRAADARAASIPVVGEIAGYVGGALSLAAIFAIVGSYWLDFTDMTRIALALAVSAVCLTGGWLLAKLDAPQAVRLGGFLLFLSTAGFGFSVNLITDVGYGDTAIAATAGTLTALVLARFVWLRHKTALQVVALALALGSFIVAAASLLESVEPGVLIGWAFLIVGGLWVLAGERAVLTPRTPTLVVGSIGVLAGAQALVGSRWESQIGYLLLGIAVSVCLLLTGLKLRRGVTLGFGCAGIVIFVPQVISEVFPESVAAPFALLVAGMLLVGASALLIVNRSRAKQTDND